MLRKGKAQKEDLSSRLGVGLLGPLVAFGKLCPDFGGGGRSPVWLQRLPTPETRSAVLLSLMRNRWRLKTSATLSFGDMWRQTKKMIRDWKQQIEWKVQSSHCHRELLIWSIVALGGFLFKRLPKNSNPDKPT